MNRDLFAKEALAQLPKILTLLDRNPHSPTYGCFDRNYWHYKIVDFPSGMAQEFCWPLALACHTATPFNPFYNQSVIRDWIEAAILFAARSSHSDGSCDDYFPYERAGGAAAFSLLACLESYQLMKLNNAEILAFFQKRGDWLAHHFESGRLTNHQALIALLLEVASRLLQTTRWAEAKYNRLTCILEWQHEEGWYPEYEGFDPGYHTLTISCLARLYDLVPSRQLRESLKKAVAIAAECSHPDGSYGGEYGSRNTYNFFPHGFEVLGKWMPEALEINDRFLEGMKNGLTPCYADDHIIGHHTWNYLLAWRDYLTDRPAVSPRRQGRVWLQGAGLLIERRKECEIYIALKKGGVFKFFRNGQLIASDTQISIQTKQGNKTRNAVGHLVDDYRIELQQDKVYVSGVLGWAKQKEMTPFRLILLRLIMLSGGRFCSDLIRKLLQKVLITGKKSAPFQFQRVFEWNGSTWEVSDEIKAASWTKVMNAGIGADQTSIYVVMSRTFQNGQLQPWFSLTDEIKPLVGSQSLNLKRTL